MARKRPAESIEVDIIKIQLEMTKVHELYNKLAEKIEALQEQKHRQQADVIMVAYLKSSQSYEEIMTFQRP